MCYPRPECGHPTETLALTHGYVHTSEKFSNFSARLRPVDVGRGCCQPIVKRLVITRNHQGPNSMWKNNVSIKRHQPVSIDQLEDRRLLSGGSSSQPLRKEEDFRSESLTAAEVQGLLAQAASQALLTQVIVITDREGVVLGSFRMRKAKPGIGRTFNRVLSKATARARTAAFFESTG